jgi:hypothetical protein
MTFGSFAPLVVAWRGWASNWRKPRASPSSSLSLSGCTQRSRLASFGATIEATMASSELSMIGLMLPALWIFSEVPVVPKQERKALTSEVGVGGLADDREPDALPLQARSLQRGDPVGGQDLVREQAAAGQRGGREGRRRAPEGRRSRPRRGAAVDGADLRARRRPARELQQRARDRVDVALDAAGQLRRVDRQRRALPTSPCRPLISCRTASVPCRSTGSRSRAGASRRPSP